MRSGVYYRVPGAELASAAVRLCSRIVPTLRTSSLRSYGSQDFYNKVIKCVANVDKYYEMIENKVFRDFVIYSILYILLHEIIYGLRIENSE